MRALTISTWALAFLFGLMLFAAWIERTRESREWSHYYVPSAERVCDFRGSCHEAIRMVEP